MRWLPWYRRATQILVIALFCALPWLHSQGYQQIRGSLFAFDAFGLPFADPASAAQAVFSGASQGFLPLPLLAGVCSALVIAFLLGRVFCGWLCPYGLCSELAWKLRRKPTKPGRRSAFRLKGAIFILLLILCALSGWPLISELSMPGQISLLPGLHYNFTSLESAVALLAIPACVLCIELVAGRRLWCNHVCPQSVLLGLAASKPRYLPGLRIDWNPHSCNCGKKAPCAKACSLGLNPRQKNGPSRRDCAMCGDCAAACSSHGGALAFTLSCRTEPMETKAEGKNMGLE